MFGKGKSKMSSTDRFVMSKGKQAGNFGNHSGLPERKVPRLQTHTRPRTLKVGKNRPFPWH
jgi:hypothetical protein